MPEFKIEITPEMRVQIMHAQTLTVILDDGDEPPHLELEAIADALGKHYDCDDVEVAVANLGRRYEAALEVIEAARAIFRDDGQTLVGPVSPVYDKIKAFDEVDADCKVERPLKCKDCGRTYNCDEQVDTAHNRDCFVAF